MPELVVSSSVFVAMRFLSSPSWMVWGGGVQARVGAGTGLMAAGVTGAKVAGGPQKRKKFCAGHFLVCDPFLLMTRK